MGQLRVRSGDVLVDYACAHSNQAADEIWNRQDGYGEPGYTPVQGWDWSGIRDSTREAIGDMLTIARRHVPDTQIAGVLGVDVDRVADIVGNLEHR